MRPVRALRMGIFSSRFAYLGLQHVGELAVHQPPEEVLRLISGDAEIDGSEVVVVLLEKGRPWYGTARRLINRWDTTYNTQYAHLHVASHRSAFKLGEKRNA